MKAITKFTLALPLLTLLFAAPAVAASISNVDFSPPSPAQLEFGEYVDFSFDYELDESSRIFGRPFFEGALRPDYAAHPSGVFLPGIGSGSGFFTIQDLGQVQAIVDSVRIEIVAGDDSTVLSTTFVPVHFVFGSVQVPEPGSLVLLGAGLGMVSLAGWRRRGSKKVVPKER